MLQYLWEPWLEAIAMVGIKSRARGCRAVDGDQISINEREVNSDEDYYALQAGPARNNGRKSGAHGARRTAAAGQLSRHAFQGLTTLKCSRRSSSYGSADIGHGDSHGEVYDDGSETHTVETMKRGTISRYCSLRHRLGD